MRKIAFLIVIILILGCGKNQTSVEKSKSAREPLRTATVVKEAKSIQIYGTTKAADVAQLASRSGGFVRQIPVKPGALVKKGELLIIIDDRNIQAQGEKLKAAKQESEEAVAEARSQLQAAESQRQLAINTFGRIEQLYSKKAASRQEFEEAESRRTAAEAEWQAASQRLAQAESRRRQLQSDLRDLEASRNYFRITAPFDGIVSAVLADEGTFVNAGQPLATVENPHHYQLVVAVEEDVLSRMTANAKFPVRIPSVLPDVLQGTVVEVSPAAGPVTHTFQVKVDLSANPLLRSGLSGFIELESASAKSLWIPVEFLRENNDLETVWVRQPEGWESVLVKSGNTKNGKVEILSGLNEGDVVGLFEVSS